jgi:hypothetical protein
VAAPAHLLKRGAFVDVPPITGDPMGIRPRGGALDVVSYSAASDGRSVIAMGPDDKVSDDLVDRAISSKWGWYGEFHDKALGHFGVRGVVFRSDPAEAIKVAWRWDEKKKPYIGARRQIPVPAKARGK